MCAAFRSHRKSATSSGSRSRPSARQFNRDVLTLDEAATPYERGPHCASQQIKLRNVPFGSEAAIGGCIFDVCFTPKSGHWLSVSGCPLCAKSRHSHCSNFLFDHLVGEREELGRKRRHGTGQARAGYLVRSIKVSTACITEVCGLRKQ